MGPAAERAHRGPDGLTFTPVDVPSTLERTVERLGTAIQLGLLPPGRRLPPERELAEQLQISRTTLRQALGELAGTGHLVALRGRSGGTFVTDSPPVTVPSRPSLPRRHREVADQRTMLEIGLAVLAAEVATEQGLAEAQAAIDAHRALDDDDLVGFLRADAAFHLALGRSTGNGLTERALIALQGECTSLLVARIRAVGPLPGGVERSRREHEGLLDAVRARDPQLAATRAREHMRMLDEWLGAHDGT